MRLTLCALLLAGQVAHAGLHKYSSLLMSDVRPDAPASADAVRVTYLGVNGYQFENGRHALLVDPYFSRVGVSAIAFSQPIKPNTARIEDGLQHIQPRVEAILVTHAHFDHLLDVPFIMRRTDARLLAGPTAVNLVESLGVRRDKCDSIRAGMIRRIGPWRIRVFPASHDRLLGKSPPFPGTIRAPMQPPARASDWKLGEPLAFVVEAAGKRIYMDSGGLPGHPPDGAIGKVDMAILGLALPDSRRRFGEAVLSLRPRYILPSHQDNFFGPFNHGFVFGSLTNFPEILRTHQTEHLPGRIILLDYFRPWTLR